MQWPNCHEKSSSRGLWPNWSCLRSLRSRCRTWVKSHENLMLLLQGKGIRDTCENKSTNWFNRQGSGNCHSCFVSLSSSWSEAANKSAQLFQFFCIHPRFRDMSPSMLLPDDHQHCAGIGHRWSFMVGGSLWVDRHHTQGWDPFVKRLDLLVKSDILLFKLQHTWTWEPEQAVLPLLQQGKDTELHPGKLTSYTNGKWILSWCSSYWK